MELKELKNQKSRTKRTIALIAVGRDTKKKQGIEVEHEVRARKVAPT
jgi:hypothetical protein